MCCTKSAKGKELQKKARKLAPPQKTNVRDAE